MSRKKLTLKLSCTLLYLLFLSLSSPSYVKADSISLKISPSVLRIEAKPPADVWTPFTIQNLSNQPVSFKIGYKAFNPQLSSNGTVVFMTNGQYSSGADKNIFDKMQVVDDENVSHDKLELGPKQQERLRLRILLPQNESNSDYYFSLIFIQNINQMDQNYSNNNIEDQKSYSTIQAGIGLNVILAVGDKEAPDGVIQTFSTPIFTNSGPIPFTLQVTNSGKHFIVPTGIIYIKNMFGQTVGKVQVPTSIVLAGTTRSFGSAENIPASAGNTQELGQVLTWPEQFLLGIYTATLTITMSDNGPVFVRSIRFLCIPVIFFLEILIVLVVVCYIYIRIKRKLSR
jgi:hypothetical protein